MSASQNTKAVDERIVEMKFDNAQFEQGVRQSTESLNRFKKAINTDGAEKAFDGIEKAANKVRLSGLNDAIEESGRHFSALQVVAISALATIASRATQVGMQMVKALSLNPILDGFREYETEMNSIKTIHANLPDTTFQEIKDTLQELNEYADLTIYSFGDMTRAIGYFTAAGVKVDAAARAIKGLSNIAAGAGANNQALARAEYQVSQALQGGVIHLMDWNSLMQAGMASPEFQQRLIENGRAMGKNVDQFIAANGSFRESLKEDWLTTDVFLKTMDQAADATTEWGKRLTDAATVVNTFTQLTGTIAEAIGTGWGETMKLILGDAEQSTELFTSIYRALDPLISAYTDFRNNQVRTWAEMGGRQAIIDGISHSFEALKNLLSPVGDLMKRIFGKSGEVMANLSKKFAEFAAKFEEKTRPIREFFRPMVEGAEKAENAIHEVKDSIEEVTELAESVINGDWGNGQERIDRLRGAGHSFEIVQNRVNELLGCEYRYEVEQDEVNDSIAEGSENLNEMSSELDEAAKKQKAATTAFDNYNNALAGFRSGLELGRKALDIFFYTAKRVWDVVSRIGISLGKIGLAIAGGLGRIVTAINSVVERLGLVDKAKDKIGGAFDKLSDPLDKFDRFADVIVDKIGVAVDFIVNKIENIEDTLADLNSKYGPTVLKVYGKTTKFIGDRVKDLLNIISQLGPKIVPLLDIVKSGLGRVVDLMGDAASKVDFSRAISFITGFAEAVSRLVTLGLDRLHERMSGLPSPISALSNAFGALKDKASGLASGLMNLFSSIKVADTFKEATGHIKEFVSTLRPLEGIKSVFSKLGPQPALGAEVNTSGVTDQIDDSIKVNKGGQRRSFKEFVEKLGVRNFIQDIQKAFDKASLGGIATSVSSFCGRIGQTFAAGIKVGSIDISRPFVTLKTIIGNGIHAIGEKISSAFDKVKIESLTKGAEGFGHRVGEMFGKIPQLVMAPLDNLKKAFDIIKQTIDSFFKGFTDGMAAVGSGLADGASSIFDLIKRVLHILELFLTNPSMGIAAVLFMIYKNITVITLYQRVILVAVARLGTALKRIGSGINNIGKGVKWGGLAAFVLSFSHAIKLLVECIDILQTISPNNIAKGIITIAFLGALLGAAALIIGKFTDLRNTMAELKKGDDPLTQFVNLLLSIRATLGNLGKAAMYTGMGVMLAGLAVGIFILIKAMEALESKDITSILEGAGKLLPLFALLVGALTILSTQGPNLQKVAVSIILMSVSIILLASAVKQWSAILKDGNMQDGITAVTVLLFGLIGVIIILAAVGGLTQGNGSGALKSAAAILVLVIAIKMIVGAVSSMADLVKEKGADVEQAMVAIRTLLVSLTLCLTLLVLVSKVGGEGKGSALASALGLTAVMWAMSQLLQQISTMPDPNGALAVVQPMVILIGVVGVVILLINKFCDPTTVWSAAIAIGGVMLCMAYVLQMLSMLDGKNLSGYKEIIDHMILALLAIFGVIALLIVIMDAVPISMAAVALIIGLFLSAAVMFAAVGYCAKMIGESIDKIAEGMDKLTGVLAKMQTLDDAAPGKLLDILGHLAGGILAVGLSNLFGGAEAMEKLAPPIGYLSFSLDKWAAVDPSVGGKIRDILAGIGDGIGHLNLGGWGADALAKCAEGIGYLGEHIRAWESVNPDLGKNIAWTLENAASGIKSLNGSVNGAESINVAAGAISYLGEHIRAWESVNPDLGKSISETLKNIAGSLNAFDGTAEGATQIGYAAYNIDKLSTSIERYSEVAPNLEGVKESQNNLTDSLANFNVTAPLTEEQIEELAQATDVSSEEMRQQLEETGVKFSTDLPENIEEGVEEGHENLEGKIPDYQGSLEKYKQSVEDAANRMKEEGSKGGNGTGENLIKGIQNQYPGAKTAAQGLGDKATEGIQESTKHTDNLGKMFTDGFLGGILGGQNDVIKAIMGFGENVINALAHVLGIRSPSREASYLGVMWNQGFKQGILKSSGDVTSSIKAVGLGVIQQVSKMNKSNEFTPKVSPVVDWSNYQNGSKQIQSTLNGISGNTNISQSIAYSRDQNILKELVEVKKDLKKYNDNLANLRPNVIIDGDVRSGVTQQFVDQRITDWANDMVQGGRSY